MTTKREDASSIIGDEYAKKLEELDRKLRLRKHKSEAAEVLILKSQARNRILPLVEKYNVLLGVATSAKRTREDVEDIARGYGNWLEKERKLKLVVRALLEDLDEFHLLDNRQVKKAVHRQVHRMRQYAERVHTECLVEELMTAKQEVAAIAADVRMRRVLGLR